MNDYKNLLLIPKKSIPYTEERDIITKFPIHRGQRKLLFLTLVFMIEISKNTKDGIIVYAGAATGKNLNIVIDLFPNFTYYLFDVNEFDKDLKNKSVICKFEERLNHKGNIFIFSEYFTNEKAAELEGSFLISDIRTGENGKNDQSSIPYDMEIQKKWCQIMKPQLYMLKFRLPWKSGKTSYLNGVNYLQPRAKYDSAETRLIGSNLEEKEYDHDNYNNRIFYHNIVRRIKSHNVDVNIPGYCYCWDCAAEQNIIKEIEILFPQINLIELYKKINKCSKINIEPHILNRKNKNMRQRLLGIKNKIPSERVRYWKIVTPRIGRKVYITNDGNQIEVDKSFYIEGEIKTSDVMEKYNINLSTEEFNNLI